ncbi:uncharacterized protein LOC131156715 isoform X2 [Malania oleifera]|uniref:uncharacterized protein LOC131156715 isoform X2 n=1 Tax=Malania oleifera TaxID=397392 RepID=UPI0025AECB5D|nr:uncharacterized protein LOC131156715 isoform X2 [Malania oleifera]
MSSTLATVALGSTGPISTPPGNSRGSCSFTITASIGGFLMGSSALQCPTGLIIFTGLKISLLLTLFQRIMLLSITLGVLILELVQTAFTLFWGRLFWVGALLDVTDVAVEWAERNVKNNVQISHLIEIRKVDSVEQTPSDGEEHNVELVDSEGKTDSSGIRAGEAETVPPSSPDAHLCANKIYDGAPIIVGVIKDEEEFDFCMCNPPFFESIEEAGLNPKTSCGGTPAEMVCPGGEQAFITSMIEDSVVLKQSFRWYTSMVGRKANLKTLVSKLRAVGVTIVKTTEFVQGHTCRWGLAWSFVPPAKKIISPRVVEKNFLSFMMEGLQRQFSAAHVLQSVESFFLTAGASCKSNAISYTVDIAASKDHCNAILKNEVPRYDEAVSCDLMQEIPNGSSCLHTPSDELCFRISVFQQTPGTLLVKGSLQHRESPVPGSPSSLNSTRRTLKWISDGKLQSVGEAFLLICFMPLLHLHITFRLFHFYHFYLVLGYHICRGILIDISTARGVSEIKIL